MMLEIKNLKKSFGEKLIFKDFSYQFRDNGIYALKGESGIGKTTLLRIIAGLDKDYDGEIIGGGAQNLSYCFQEYRLFPNLTAIDNVAMVAFAEANDEAYEKSRTLLSMLNFSDADMLLYPDEMSGGMKQRVAFSRAVLKKSKILLLDEVTKELDAALVKRTLEIIKEASNERLVIMISHNDDDLENLNATVIDIT